MIKIERIEKLSEAAQKFLERIGNHKIIAFYGEMGAGKTTFITAICKFLNVKDRITSPTFSIVNEYLTKENETIYHFDFYRLDNPEEALDFGVEEYFYSGNLCLIEWPEKIGSILPSETLKVQITEKLNFERVIELLN